MHSSFRPILFLALALGPCSVVAQQAVDADTPVEQAQVAETSPTAGAPSAEQAPPEMAEIEEAWRQGDFVLVREGLRHLAEEGGTALAQYRYGRVLLEGKGGPQEVAEGVVWLERAVAQNEPGAATLLARVLMTDGIDDTTFDEGILKYLAANCPNLVEIDVSFVREVNCVAFRGRCAKD